MARTQGWYHEHWYLTKHSQGGSRLCHLDKGLIDFDFLDGAF